MCIDRLEIMGDKLFSMMIMMMGIIIIIIIIIKLHIVVNIT